MKCPCQHYSDRVVRIYIGKVVIALITNYTDISTSKGHKNIMPKYYISRDSKISYFFDFKSALIYYKFTVDLHKKLHERVW